MHWEDSGDTDLPNFSSRDDADMEDRLFETGGTMLTEPRISVVYSVLGLPLSLIKCFRHNSSRCAAMKQSGIEQIFRQTTPSNFFREPFSISMMSPFFGFFMSTVDGTVATERRWLDLGREVLGSEVDGDGARRRFREWGWGEATGGVGEGDGGSGDDADWERSLERDSW